MFGSEIKTRVQQAINQRIEAGEAQYSEQCAQFDKECEEKKDAAANDIVNKILQNNS